MLEKINAFVWGVPALALMLGVGLFLSLRTGFVQLRLLGPAFRQLGRSLKPGDGTSSFRALCTALAATVGTGNIAGVAGAIAIGGPGAVFWMWVSGFVGMATKYAEAVLAVRYREKIDGEGTGGPMYIIRNGLGRGFHWLACVYSFFGIVAALGVGNATQINAVISSARTAAESFGLSFGEGTALFIGIGLAILVWRMVSGGAGGIGSAAELLVPFASVVYVLLCLGAVFLRLDRLGEAFGLILTGAFSPGAVTGGAVGSLLTAMRLGVSRGVFSNEAGMGTAAMAHAGADVAHPAQQGLMGILEVFIDTILICTMTALVILVSGVEIPYGAAAGAELTALALGSCYGPWVTVLLSLCLGCFALATILGWGLYAGRCVQFLFGSIRWKAFALCQGGFVLLGAMLETGIVWSLSETVNGLMAIPNLVALLLLSGQVAQSTKQYYVYLRGTYENFHQCKPLRTLSHEKVPPLRRGGGGKGPQDLSSEHRPA